MSPRPRATDTRRPQILEAAADVIADRGMAEARLADIAGRIGVSPALILYYFATKDILLGEALAMRDLQFIESVTAAMADQDSPTERLVTLIEASCPSGSDQAIDDEYVLWIEMWSRARHDSNLAKVRREMDVRWRETISAVIASGQKTGEFSSAVQPDEIALRLSALIDGLAIQVVLGDDHVDTNEMRRLCLAVAGETLGVRLP